MTKEHFHGHVDDEILLKRLKNASLSNTPTRLGILQLLSKSHRVWTIDQLITALKKSSKANPSSLVFTTVYRCLLKMEEAKLLKRAELGDGVSRFEYDDGHSHHHHHVVCRKCESIEALDHCGIKAIENLVKKMGYHEITHELQFFGICKACT